MQSIPVLAALLPRALLFDGDAYLEIKMRPQAARDGARLLLVLGLALGLAGVLQATLHWLASPDAAYAQAVWARELAALPLARRVGGLAAPAGWRGLAWLARWRQPAPLAALLRLALAPASLLGGWLAFGLLAHGLARAMGGQARLGLTLGCLALAEAPQALLLVPLLPPLGPAMVGLWAWLLATRFQALRAAHGLDGWRALWATLGAGLVVAVLGLAGLGAMAYVAGAVN